MRVMCGAMVETRLGLTAMGHIVAALGGADYVDLDTAFLLADDPFEGGFSASQPTSPGSSASPGPVLELSGGPGLDVRRRRN
jgi:L-Ala-D/L-Glu epimerase